MKSNSQNSESLWKDETYKSCTSANSDPYTPQKYTKIEDEIRTFGDNNPLE